MQLYWDLIDFRLVRAGETDVTRDVTLTGKVTDSRQYAAAGSEFLDSSRAVRRIHGGNRVRHQGAAAVRVPLIFQRNSNTQKSFLGS